VKDHYLVDIEYHEDEDRYELVINELPGIEENEPQEGCPGEQQSDRFILEDYPELAWLKGFLIRGYPDVISVPFRMPIFEREYVPARIERYEQGCFYCRVLCQPRMKCKINKGDLIEVTRFRFEGQNWLRCTTIEERNKSVKFEWR
jgi:hypothetical protein